MKKLFLLVLPILTIFSCSDDDDGASVVLPMPTGESKVYQLNSVADPSISGTATFIENDDNTTTINLQLTGTPDGGMHPAHIHVNSAAEGGPIALTLGTVDGTTGSSTITTGVLDFGDDDASNDEPITYDQLLQYDGYINVHLSASELETIVAQGDIGENELTGEEKVYELGEKDVPGISGTATFSKRINGEALAVLDLTGTIDGAAHPAHIHMNTAAKGGAIAFTFTPVDGTTGMSVSNLASLDFGDDDDSNDVPFSYDEVLEYDGYINVHLGPGDDLATIVAQGDIGENELTGEEKVYELGEKDVPGISGTATFSKRINGEALAVLDLTGTIDGAAHPAHIHMNTALESGAIAFTFTPVDGTTGMSVSNLALLDFGDDDDSNDVPFSYDELLAYDGYINVHLGPGDDLATIVAQGDVGQNELTGETVTYSLGELDVPGINGDVIFEERVNGEALATISLVGTIDGATHPAHIHAGSVANAPGDIIFTFNPVDGTTGVSATNVTELDDESDFGYQDVLTVDGYVNVHLGPDADLATIVAQGNVGANVN